RLPASGRRLLERRLRALIVGHAERALFDEAHEVGVPEPIPPRPSERMDRARYWDPMRHYLLPSYNRQGKKVLAPVDDVITFSEAEEQSPQTLGWITNPAPDD